MPAVLGLAALGFECAGIRRNRKSRPLIEVELNIFKSFNERTSPPLSPLAP